MLKKLCDYLDKHNIRYLTMRHSPAITAQEIAEAAHIHGQEFAKTVIVNLDGNLVMAVLPASEKLDTDLLLTAGHGKKAELAGESEFQNRFPECEVGAMPPFGNLFDMDVYIEESMTSSNKITFNAGTHTELIQMSMEDFLNLLQPRVVRICKSYTE
ncbi:MAG TPA: YbaK/EbsC family protein [Gammaproteobacteria bacterium]